MNPRPPGIDGQPGSAAQRVVRVAVHAAAWAVLVLGAPAVLAVPPGTLAAFFALVLAARLAPVAVPRDRPIRFAPAAVFACSVIANGPAAGWIGLAACAVDAQLRHRGRAALLGAPTYALGSAASWGLFRAMLGAQGLPLRPGLWHVLAMVAAAAAFCAVQGAVALAVAPRRARVREALRREPVSAQAVSFTAAMGVALVSPALGPLTVPALAVLGAICGGAVRMTVESGLLARQLRAVERLAAAAQSGTQADGPLAQFLALTREVVPYDRGYLLLPDDETGCLEARFAFPRDEAVTRLSEVAPEDMAALVLRRGQPMVVVDTGRDPRTARFPPGESLLFCPLLVQGKAVGLAQFVRSAAAPFHRSDSHRISPLLAQAAVASEGVHVRQMMRHFENMATTDGLTGLLNHRRLQEVLRLEVERAVRYRRSLSILMLDVDAFKAFNDTYGHPQGDVLLRAIARILRTGVRSVDHVGRYGGEEFLAILPETSREDAAVLAERIRCRVADEGFPTGDGRRVRKTISIGLSAYPENAASATELVQAADAALYRAKRSGRNRVLTA